jgi:AraC-like DNA-binding protein
MHMSAGVLVHSDTMALTMDAAPMADGWSRYLTPTAALRRTGLACHGAGRKSGRLVQCGPRRINTWAFVLITDGRGWLTFEGRTRQRVESPAVFWLEPGIRHTYAPAPSWHEDWVLFDGIAVDGYRQLGIVRPNTVSTLDDLGPVRTALQSVEVAVAEADSHPVSELAATTALSGLMLALARHQASENHGPLLAQLRQHGHEPWGVAEHAAHLGLTARSLRAQVLEATGMSARDYITATRITMAKELLAQTDLGVAQVGARLGIDDPAYFCRLFSRHVGTAPSVWRAGEDR